MRNWWKNVVTSRLPKKKTRPDRRVRPRLELLETRVVPSFSVGPNFNITKTAGNEQETSITINPTNPQNLFASSTSGFNQYFSMDGGATWTASDISSIDSGTNGGDQQAAWDQFGNLFMTYFATNTVVALSTDGGKTFSLSLDTGGFFDQPNIAVGAGEVWVDYTNGGNRDAQGAAVTGLGQVGTWSAAQTPPGNGGSFGDLAIGASGQVMAVYQDNNGDGTPANMYVSLDPDGLGSQGYGPQLVLGTTNVGSFDPTTPQPDRPIDAEMSLAWDRSGGAHNNRVYLVYTDEIPDESNDTEIFLRFSDDNGATWSVAKRINDDPIGNKKAQFLCAVAVDQGSGALAISWLDARNSAGNNKVETFFTMSLDGGATFEPNTKVSAGVSDGLVDSFNFGDYNKMDFAAGVIAISWADNSNSTGDNPAGAGAALDLYGDLITVTIGAPPVPGTGMFALPNPVDEGKSTTLRGDFVDADGQFQSHKVAIDWADGSKQTLSLTPGLFSFSAKHTYLDNSPVGTPFDVKVTVIDSQGNRLNNDVLITVNNLPPVAEITGVPATIQDEGKKITLGAKVTDPGVLDTFSYAWTVQKNGVDFFTSSGAGLTFIPDDQGFYTVFLSVKDDDDGECIASPVTIEVRNVAPTADGLTNDGPAKTATPVNISFVNVFDADADVAAGLRYDYDFDNDGVWDLVNSPDSSVQHSYATQGVYTVKAHITDKDGAVGPNYFTDVIVSDVSGGNGGIVTTRFIAAGSDAGRAAVVKVFDLTGLVTATIAPFGATYLGGVRVATGDVNGDKTEDIIAANGAGKISTIKVYDGTTGLENKALSTLYTQRLSNIYPATFTSGLQISTADINRDGFADILVGPAKGAQPVAVISGQDGSELARFFPFGKSYANGVSVAAGDVNGDRTPDLIVGQSGGGSRVAVFSGLNLNGSAIRTFNAFVTTFVGGVNVAAGDTNGDGRTDIVVATNLQFTYTSRVRVYSGLDNAIMKDFVPFPAYKGGVRVAVEDLDGDGKADILISPGKFSSGVGSKPHVMALRGTTLVSMADMVLSELAFLGGVWVG